MVIIKCSPYEKGDFIRVLEYAKQKKQEEMEQGKITKELYNYEVFLIDKLINCVNGHYIEDTLLNSKEYREKNSTKKENYNRDSLENEMGLI